MKNAACTCASAIPMTATIRYSSRCDETSAKTNSTSMAAMKTAPFQNADRPSNTPIVAARNGDSGIHASRDNRSFFIRRRKFLSRKRSIIAANRGNNRISTSSSNDMANGRCR